MRAYVPAYDLRQPANLAEALAWMNREPGAWQPFAGGTDLMVLLEAGKLAPGKFLSLAKLADLKGFSVTTDEIVLGAATTYTEVQRHSLLQREFPLLCAAARETGSVATQNRGTLGGNIANASPAADSPPALLVYDADIELVSSREFRRMPYREFHLAYKKTQLAGDELVFALRLPRSRGTGWMQHFRKVGTRRAQAISKVCFAGAADVASDVVRDVRIAMGSVAPIPLRCARTEDALRGQRLNAATVESARRTLEQEIAPIADVRSTARYRSRVAGNLLEEFLAHCISRS